MEKPNNDDGLTPLGRVLDSVFDAIYPVAEAIYGNKQAGDLRYLWDAFTGKLPLSVATATPVAPYTELPDPTVADSVSNGGPVSEFSGSGADALKHLGIEADDDDDAWDNPEVIKRNFGMGEDLSYMYAKVSLDDGDRDAGVIIDGPHKGKRAHKGKWGLWVVETPIGRADVVDEDNRVDPRRVFAANSAGNVEVVPNTVDTVTPYVADFTETFPPADIEMRTDRLWRLIFEKYRLIDLQHLMRRRAEIELLLSRMIAFRQMHGDVGRIDDRVFDEFESQVKREDERRLATPPLGDINLRKIKDNPQG